jgi:hypothetical protein
MHVALPVGDRALKQRRLRGEMPGMAESPSAPEVAASEARALCHVHALEALGAPSCLLIGRDDGALDIIRDDHEDWNGWSDLPEQRREPVTRPSFHVDTWWSDPAARARRVSMDRRVPRAASRRSPACGITAIQVLVRPGEPGLLRILVATRSLHLYLIEACNRELRLVQQIPMPGWIQWIIGPQRESASVTCISRGGDIVRLLLHDNMLVHAEDPEDPVKLSVLPTAAMAFGDRSLLLGTTTGLVLVDRAHPEGIAVPVTRSAVLCLAQAEMRDGEHIHRYVTMGLEDRRLRVADMELLRALAHGTERTPPHDQSLAFELNSAVLAVETVQLGVQAGDGEPATTRHDTVPSDTAYVLAVLRDHSVRLFQVITQHAQRKAIRERWTAYVAHRVAEAQRPTTEHFSNGRWAASEPVPEDWPDDWRQAWDYMLVDIVLPGLCTLVADSAREQEPIVELACQIAMRADRRVLWRLSLSLRELTRDVGLQLRLSRAILRAVPHHDDRRWEAFVDGHLRELNALARSASEHDDRMRLVAWARFVRKFIRRGNTFSSKRTRLLDLVTQNERAGKSFDALVYLAQLSQRCYDLRWESAVATDVAELHTVDVDLPRLIVVVVTIDATLMFLDGSTGRLLVRESEAFEHDGAPAVLVPFRRYGVARTLASVAVRERAGLRVVLSATGAGLKSPGIAIVDADVVWQHGDPTLRLKQELVLDEINEHAFIHAVRPVPRRTDAFVVGLATRDRPIGLLECAGGTWTLKIATDRTELDRGGSAGKTSFDQSSLAPGKIPTRALAVAAVDDKMSRYLVVAGSDDGLVRAISFSLGTPVEAWQIDRWEQVADAVTSAALGRHPKTKDGDLFSCYLGTVAGDVFALSILPRGHAGASETKRFADYEAQPLWRESHEGPVLAMQLWPTPMYRMDDGSPDEVLVVVTQRGRLCLYQHSHRGKQRLASSSSYYYRGMRFDRLSMPDRLRALAMVDGGRDFVAAGPAGQMYKGALLYLRESAPDGVHGAARDGADPSAPDGAPSAPAAAARSWSVSEPPQPYHELVPELWARLGRLFAASTLHEQFSRNEVSPDDLKLELCDLVRLEGGALSAYALRRRLLHTPWSRENLTAHDLREQAQKQLGVLKPEKAEDAEQIKVILKSLCRTFLYRRLDKLRTEILGDASSLPSSAVPDNTRRAADEWNAKTAAACKVVSDYLTREVGYATTAAARLRIVAIKELLCVPVLHHIAHADPKLKTRHSVTSALAACLRDDDQLVRIEALRAVSVMLRNVGVMADAAGTDRARFIKALFPQDLDSVAWLLDLLVGGLRRFPGFTRRTALVSGAWYLIKALLPLFRIFDHRTLALCERLIREGLDIEVLALCLRSLRGRNTGPIRNRIAHFYFPTSSKEAYLTSYHQRGEDLWLWLDLATPRSAAATGGERPEGSPRELDDVRIAHRMSYLLDQLAVMWKVKDLHELGQIRKIQPPTGSPSALETIVADLTSLAADLAARRSEGQSRLAALRAQYDAGHRRGAATDPVHNIVRGILEDWDHCTDPTPYSIALAPGREINGYRLGAPIVEGWFEALFNVEAGGELVGDHVIRVLRRMRAAPQFLERARRNQELAKGSPYVLEVVAIHEGPPPSYVQPKYRVLNDNLDLDDKRQSHFHLREDAPRWVAQVAVHIADALRAAHATDRSHGAVTPLNIVFNGSGEDRRFYLRDFGAAGAFGTAVGGSLGLVPEHLSKKDTYTGADGRKPWDDVVSLLLVLYQMLTGQTVDLHKIEDPRHLTRIDDLKGQSRFQSCLLIMDQLYRLFNREQPSFDITEFTAWTTPASQPIETDDGHSMVILLVPANTSVRTRFALDDEQQKIKEGLSGRSCRLFRFQRHGHREPVTGLAEQIQKNQGSVVHIRGEGTSRDAPTASGNDGRVVAIEASEIADLVRDNGDHVRCVVLAACYSRQLAESLVASVDVVVRISAEVIEARPGTFAGAFYAALAKGSSVKSAFDEGYAAVADAIGAAMGERAKSQLDGVTAAAEPLVELHVRHGVDPATLRWRPRSG